MTVYRIEHRGSTYDCWGCSEWDYWRPYGKKVYSTKEKAEEAMSELGLRNDCDNEFRIGEIEFVCDYNDD